MWSHAASVFAKQSERLPCKIACCLIGQRPSSQNAGIANLQASTSHSEYPPCRGLNGCNAARGAASQNESLARHGRQWVGSRSQSAGSLALNPNCAKIKAMRRQSQSFPVMHKQADDELWDGLNLASRCAASVAINQAGLKSSFSQVLAYC